ncbi:MAG: DUF998 domain-containing protein [Actinobacteria bacterium HGW-Actinobacteria-4]|nr:MAG: DUF998 domain-containing protein [Actinobacteria bacterium HGW-Actinobacteria-4]
MSTTTAPSAPSTNDVDECPPETRITKSLLGYGIIAGPFYVIASLTQALLREGFDLSRHSWSLLANGALGWVHVMVLILTGLMVTAAAVGVSRQLRSRIAGVALGVYGAGMVGAGIFPADPADGFPVGTPAGMPDVTTLGLLHFAFGGVGFLAFTVACAVIARGYFKARDTRWAAFSLATGVIFFAAFAGLASGGTGPLVLAFVAAVVLAWSWLTALNLRLFRDAVAMRAS